MSSPQNEAVHSVYTDEYFCRRGNTDSKSVVKSNLEKCKWGTLTKRYKGPARQQIEVNSTVKWRVGLFGMDLVEVGR